MRYCLFLAIYAYACHVSIALAAAPQETTVNGRKASDVTLLEETSLRSAKADDEGRGSYVIESITTLPESEYCVGLLVSYSNQPVQAQGWRPNSLTRGRELIIGINLRTGETKVVRP